MVEKSKKVYALDFDGVICDSAVETGITGWKVAQKIWPEMPSLPSNDMLNAFRKVRPVMETGYEAILIMYLLFKGISASELLTNFSKQIRTLIEKEHLSIAMLKLKFGETRDLWIESNLSDWIAMNPLFNGIVEKLQHLDFEQAYIITTKQERFVQQIFQANDIQFPAERIFGLDRKLSKTQILADLLTKHHDHAMLFVEDRLPTLINVINDPRLEKVKLFFANWGYNTKQDKKKALKLNSVSTINLTEFKRL